LGINGRNGGLHCTLIISINTGDAGDVERGNVCLILKRFIEVAEE
jgi:hypothetical protein